MSGSAHRTTRVTAGALLLVAGCQSHDTPTERYRDTALQSAYEIGQIEMDCPEATPTITSGERFEAPPDPPAFRASQLDYTVEVAGCGASRTYLIVCREDGGGCAPATP